MKYKIIFVALLSLPMWAQEKTWSLTDCINYAVTNNISVKKTELSQQTASINLHQAKSNRLPSIAANASANVNNGSVINQITNDRVNQTTFTNSFGVSASLPLYEGGKLGLQTERTQLVLEQSELYRKEAQNNITLSVLEAYLQALYQYENITAAKNTARSSEEELAQARKRFENGAIAKIDLIEIETQNANNQYNIILAQNQYETQVLALKQLLELPIGTDFKIEIIQKEEVSAPIENKEEIFRQALQHLPNTKVYAESQAELDRRQAEKDLYTKIETAWHNATTRQAQEVASKTARDNAKLAYELAQKKHEFGNLTNTELLVSRNTYLNAEQTYLQNKYMVLLYQQLLNFYQGKEIIINN